MRFMGSAKRNRQATRTFCSITYFWTISRIASRSDWRFFRHKGLKNSCSNSESSSRTLELFTSNECLSNVWKMGRIIWLDCGGQRQTVVQSKKWGVYEIQKIWPSAQKLCNWSLSTGYWQVNLEGSSPPKLAVESDLSFVLLHDVLADRHPQASTLCWRLGGEERLKDPLLHLWSHSSSRVTYPNQHFISSSRPQLSSPLLDTSTVVFHYEDMFTFSTGVAIKITISASRHIDISVAITGDAVSPVFHPSSQLSGPSYKFIRTTRIASISGASTLRTRSMPICCIVNWIFNRTSTEKW